MERIMDANNNRKGLVGSATLKIDNRTGNENSKQKLRWPIDKIVFLLETDFLNDNFQKWVQYPHLGTIVKLCEAVPEWGTVGFGY